MATTDITKAFVAGGSTTTWTLSGWFKRAGLGQQRVFSCENGSGTNSEFVGFNSNNQIEFVIYTSSSDVGAVATNAKYRDVGAWYHITAVWDTTQSTSTLNGSATDRMRLYVNGEQLSSWSASTIPAEDAVCSQINNDGTTFEIGSRESSNQYFDGEMSHLNFCSNNAYAASDFGETDATSGIWKIKTSPSVTYGTNGFFLKMEDRTNLDLDSGTNAFTFTTSGTLTATYDSPSNNFATMNPLNKMGGSSPTFSNGNNTYLQGGTSQYYPSAGTMGLSAGLWYWEGLYTSGNASLMGIAGDASVGTNMVGTSNNYLGYTSEQWALYTETGVYYTGTTGTSYGVAVATDTIIGFYLDLTANKLYFANNGTIMNSGTGISITAAASTKAGYYVPSASYWGSNTTFKFNFGNGYLGTTAVTSAVADAGGIGAFEFDPSDGGGSSFDGSAKNFRAICTKNIKAYGG